VSVKGNIVRLIKIFRVGMGAASLALGVLSAYALISSLTDRRAGRG